MYEQIGLALKDEGMSKALGKEGLDAWKEEFYKAAQYLCDSGDTFTSEDVLDLVGLPSGTIKSNANNAVGAMMNGMARKGVIRKTGERRLSKRPSSHGAELTVWASARALENRDRNMDASPTPVPTPVCEQHRFDTTGACYNCDINVAHAPVPHGTTPHVHFHYDDCGILHTGPACQCGAVTQRPPHGTYANCPSCTRIIDIGYYHRCIHCGANLRDDDDIVVEGMDRYGTIE